MRQDLQSRREFVLLPNTGIVMVRGIGGESFAMGACAAMQTTLTIRAHHPSCESSRFLDVHQRSLRSSDV